MTRLGSYVALRVSAVLIALAVVLAAAQAETRLALVIANGAYTTGPLANTVNDGELMVRTLRSLGFEVTRHTNADQKTLRKAIVEFGRRLRGSDVVGLFYYAGHGVQVDGENYIVPIGADIKDEKDVPVESIAFSELLRTMERAQSRINIAIFDACRDNPFAGTSRGGVRGLAGIDAPTGTIISYATAPGHVAYDGTGTANSPFTAALAATMISAGLPIEDVFKRTRRAVLASTANKQTPWEASSLTGDFYFKPKSTAPEASGRADGSETAWEAARLDELHYWERTKKSGLRGDYERYLATYPNGVFAELARLKMTNAKSTSPTLWPWSTSTADIVTGSNRSEQRNDPEALFGRAALLDQQGATTAQLEEAARLYRLAADLGFPAAQHALASLYDRGRGVPRDLAAAASLYAKAAERGYAPSMAALGTMLEFGEGIPANPLEALRLYELAAERGDINAMTSLAYLHAAGKGVVRNYAAARQWYKSAADAGQSRAMFNLALMNIRGEGAAPDFAEAVRLLNLATEKGHLGAMRELAFLYDEGRGTARDPAKAANLLLTAFKAGHRGAREDLFARASTWSLGTRRTIQEVLTAAGTYHGRINGMIDVKTRTALDAFAALRSP